MMDRSLIPKKLNSVLIKSIKETPEISLGFSQPAFKDFFKVLSKY